MNDAGVPHEPPTADLVETATRAADLDGAVVSAWRGMRTQAVIVIQSEDDRAQVVLPSGQVAWLPMARIRETLHQPAREVKSVPGRLVRLLENPRTADFRPGAVEDVVRAEIAAMLEQRRHALGLLLDAGALALGLDDCLSLPIEPWRVRYEFLARADAEPRFSSILAVAIIRDPETPYGVKLAVALRTSADVPEWSPELGTLLGTDRASSADLRAAAHHVASALMTARVPSAQRLKLAAYSPHAVGTQTTSGAVLSALTDSPAHGQAILITPNVPSSIVDDLIDRRVTLDLAGVSQSVNPANAAITPTYIKARVDPKALTSEELVELRFEHEAIRRFLAGDDSARAAIPEPMLADAEALRGVLSGDPRAATGRTPLVRELVSLLASPTTSAPSDALLGDPSVWRPLIDAGVPANGSGGARNAEYAGVSALVRSAQALYEWRWEEARHLAREGLRSSRREAVRDELLNVIACSFWLDGEPDLALSALDNALEGEYTDELLVNASVVASELEHHTARDRLVRIAREAPSVHQRSMAAERALFLWLNDDARIWEEDDEGLPIEIRDALRPLIREELPDDRYLRLLRVLAFHDDEWLAGQGMNMFGRRSTSAMVRVFKARASGLDDFARALAAEIRAGSTEEWLLRERDSIVESATEVLFERNDEFAAAFFGLSLIDADLPMAASQSIPLRCLTVASITSNIDSDESEPNLRFIDLVVGCSRDVHLVDEDDQDRMWRLITIAAERLAAAYFGHRAEQFDDAMEAFRMIMVRVGSIPTRNLNKVAVRENLAPIREFLHDTWVILNKLRPHLEDYQLASAVDSIISQASDAETRMLGVLS